MSYENITLERDGAVATVTINRPKVLNALNAQTLTELEAAVEAVASDGESRALLITGSGEKAFVAGADIGEIRQIDGAAAALGLARRGQELFARFAALPLPVIAAVNGFALGGGCELALACDLRIAADTARFGLPEINLGIIPGYGGTQRLARLVGKGLAKKLVLTGEMVDAAEALRIGLVEEVVAAAELPARSAALAKQLADKAPVAVAMAKQAIDQGVEVDLERGCALEAARFAIACATEDRVEGTTAFLEKRSPQFCGR